VSLSAAGRSRKHDYPPIKVPKKDFMRLMGVDDPKYIPVWASYRLYKWDIHTRCTKADEIGFCYQYRLYRSLWFYILTWIPGMLYRLHLAIWEYGLLYFTPYERLFMTYEIKNGDESLAGLLDEGKKREFTITDYYWREHSKHYI
jgi:hypothetical protein